MPRIKQTAKSLHGRGAGKGFLVAGRKGAIVGKATVGGKRAAGGKGAVEGAIKGHKRRWRSGTVAKREIRKMSRTTHNLLKSLPFRRLVRGIALDIRPKVRISAKAMKALHAGAEAFLPEHFIKADIARMHRQCKTLMVKDMQMASHMSYTSSELVRRVVEPKEEEAGEEETAGDEEEA